MTVDLSTLQAGNDNTPYPGFRGHSRANLLDTAERLNLCENPQSWLHGSPCYGRSQDNYAWLILFEQSSREIRVENKRASFRVAGDITPEGEK